MLNYQTQSLHLSPSTQGEAERGKGRWEGKAAGKREKKKAEERERKNIEKPN